MWTEPAPVNPHGVVRDVMSVNQDTGELIVNRDVVLDVIIMNVTKKMENVHVNMGGQERNVKTVYSFHNKYHYLFNCTTRLFLWTIFKY